MSPYVYFSRQIRQHLKENLPAHVKAQIKPWQWRKAPLQAAHNLSANTIWRRTGTPIVACQYAEKEARKILKRYAEICKAHPVEEHINLSDTRTLVLK